MQHKTPARRSFLAAITAAIAAPAAAALPALPAKAEPIAEAPELLAIGAKLPDLTARLHAAKARMDEARAAFDRLKPAVPPEIIAPQGDPWAVMVRGVDNEPVRSDGLGFIDVFDSKRVRAHVILYDVPRNTKEGRRIRRIARVAQKYERDHAAAVRASGFNEARSAMVDLRCELQDLTDAALQIKPSTIEGVAVYAAIVVAGAGPNYEDRPRGFYEGPGVVVAQALIDMQTGQAA